MIRLLIALFILMSVLSMDHIMTPKLPENNDDEVKNQVIPDLTPKSEEEVIIEEPKDKSLREGIYISKGNMIFIGYYNAGYNNYMSITKFNFKH